MRKDAMRIPDPVSRSVYFGLVEDVPDAPGCSDYLSAFEVAADAKAIPGMLVRRFPPLRCGIVRYVGLHAPEALDYAKLLAIKNVIRSRWLAGQTATKAPRWHLERIDGAQCSNDYCAASLIFPA